MTITLPSLPSLRRPRLPDLPELSTLPVLAYVPVLKVHSAAKARKIGENISRMHHSFRLRQYRPMPFSPCTTTWADHGGHREEGDLLGDEEDEEEGEGRRGGEEQFTVPISSLATQTISESDEGTSALLLPELADLVPQSAPTHPMRSPPAMIAWSAPAPPQPPPQPQYVNMFAGSLSGFTPQQEISVNTIWHSTSTPPSARVAPSQPNPTASPPSTKSKADEWLASTLQASLTMSPTHSASGITSAAAGASSSASPSLSAHSASLSSAPPAYPAPPLPPAAVLASPDRPVGEALFEATESVHPSWAAAGVVGATNGHSSQTGKASFPTVFSPDQPLPPSNFPNPAPAPSPAVAVCADPFDVQWSRLALSNSGN